MAVNPDDIPRYEEPQGDEFFHEPTAAELMRECMHCSACWRMIERLTDDIWDRARGTSDRSWEHAAMLAGCDDCEEYE